MFGDPHYNPACSSICLALTLLLSSLAHQTHNNRHPILSTLLNPTIGLAKSPAAQHPHPTPNGRITRPLPCRREERTREVTHRHQRRQSRMAEVVPQGGKREIGDQG
jgi:hypothetical protein